MLLGMDGMLVHRRVTPSIKTCHRVAVAIYTLGRVRQCERNLVTCPRMQHSDKLAWIEPSQLCALTIEPPSLTSSRSSLANHSKT